MRKSVSVISVLICLIMVFALFACGQSAPKDVILSDVLSSVNAEFDVAESDMLTIEDKDTLELYYNIAPADVKQFAAETTLNSATDITEFIFVEAVDSDAAKRVYDALDVRYHSQRDLCASYSADLLAIVNECSVEQNGNFVCLIMTDDFDTVSAHYNSFFN